MDIFIVFLEGIVTFISPCLLPMLPIYISYFAGGKAEESNKNVLRNCLGFVLGFTLVFVALGAFAGSIGQLFRQYQATVNLVTGLIVIVFGLSFLGLFNLPFLNLSQHIKRKESQGFFSFVLFGAVFSIGWTPCVGAFLGSALMLASSQGSVLKGILMLLAFSLGLGIPFVASALLINQLKSTFDFIKRNYKIINIICGVLLIIVGIMMATGTLGYLWGGI